MYSPLELVNRTHDVPFLRDNVVPELRDAVGAGNLSVAWLESAPKAGKYTPPSWGETFGAAETIGQVEAVAAAAPTTPGLPDALTNAKTQGVKVAVEYLQDRAKDCPNQRFVLGAHSLGAWVLGDALADPALKSLLPRIDEVLLFGDPRFDSSASAARRPEDLDQIGPPKALGIAARVLGIGTRTPYLPGELDGRSQSYCWGGPGTVDPVCGSFEQPETTGSTGQPVTQQQWLEAMDNCGVAPGQIAGPLSFSLRGAVTLGRECGHIKYTGGYAREYTHEIGGPHPTPTSPSVPVTVAVSSTTSAWRDTTLTVKKGQKVKVTHVTGTWTVDKDNTHLNRVGPAGYPATTQAENPQCKLDGHQAFGRLLAGVEEFRSPVAYDANGDVGTFTAPADGRVSLTINDTCTDNNAGLITVRVEIES